MEKRYQVFISSTSTDLEPAGREVSEALLKSNCFPAQMELWGAVDEEQFEYIKQMIDMSDYFIVVSAGMYGSIHPQTGISYTEMEYDYALGKGVPILRFVHADPFSALTGKFIEQSDARRRKLLAFHDKLKTGKLCKLWNDPQELGKEVIVGLNDLTNRRPAVGWVRSNILSELSDEAKKAGASPPAQALTSSSSDEKPQTEYHRQSTVKLFWTLISKELEIDPVYDLRFSPKTIDELIFGISQRTSISQTTIEQKVRNARDEVFNTKYGNWTEVDDERHAGGIELWNKEFLNVLHTLGIDFNEEAVGVGIGCGLEGVGIYSRFKHFSGYDISKRAVDRARDAFFEFENVRIATGAAELVHEETEKRDLYISLKTYQSTYFDVQKAIHAAARVLNRDCWAIISVPRGYYLNGEFHPGLSPTIYNLGVLERNGDKGYGPPDRAHILRLRTEIEEHLQKYFWDIRTYSGKFEHYICARQQ